MAGRTYPTTSGPVPLARVDSLNLPRLRHRLRDLLLYAVLLALSAFVLLPVFWMLTVALKPDNTPVFTLPPQWFPTEYFEWRNFLTVFTDPIRPFWRYTLNTLFLFAANVVGTLLSCTLVAFAFAACASAAAICSSTS